MSRFLRMSVMLLTLSVGTRSVSAQDAVAIAATSPADLELHQNYPNPFDSETTFPFVLHEGLFEGAGAADVSIRILNLRGQVVASPVALDHPAGVDLQVVDLEYLQPGAYEAFWDGKGVDGELVPSGVYMVEMSVDGQRRSRRIYRTRADVPGGGAR